MIKVFLDSGAYSAWRLGQAIDLDEYIDFVRRNENLLACYVGLDLIPGTDGVCEWRPDIIDEAAKQSYRNHRTMMAEGLTPIPVFHHGESFDWLKRYADDGEHFVAVSVKGNPYQAVSWLDDVFALLKPYPDVRVHGLGVTSLPLLRRYPFASVDSGTWLKQSAAGQIPVPRYMDDRPDYRLPHHVIAITDRAFARSNYVDGLDEAERDRLNQFLKKVGIDLAEAKASPRYRWRCWLEFFRGVQGTCTAEVIPVTDGGQRDLLVEHGFDRHLLSYRKVRSLRANALEEYVLCKINAARMTTASK